MMIAWRRLSARIAVAALLMAGTSVTGCTDPLEVKNPTLILPSGVSTQLGALYLRTGVIGALNSGAPHGIWLSGLLADEFRFQQEPMYEELAFPHDIPDILDRRMNATDQARALFPINFYSYDVYQGIRGRSAPVAIEKIRAYAPNAKAYVGELFTIRAYAAMRLAEDYCAGFAFNEAVNFNTVYGEPLSTQQAFEYALANYDTAITLAADTARILDFARVGRARTLLQLGRFAEAATAAAAVATTFKYQAEYSQNQGLGNSSSLHSEAFSWGFTQSVADAEGTNGLDFVSATDPRVPTSQRGTGRGNGIALYGLNKYPNYTSPIPIATGLEARLIEAEAALKVSDPSWLTILNDLRATQISPALPALADPGTPDAQLDLLFRERAFWLFATGTRLGDLHRLVSVYGRSNDAVFPTGAYWRGGTYGPMTALTVPKSELKAGAPSCAGT